MVPLILSVTLLRLCACPYMSAAGVLCDYTALYSYILSGAHEGRRPEGASNYDLCVGLLSAAGPYMANHKIPDT